MNFTSILDEHNIRYIQGGDHPHVREGWIGVDCPFCGMGTEKYHLGFNEGGGYTVCWKCGYHRVPDVLAALTGEPWWKFKGAIETQRRLQQKRIRGRLKVPKGLEDRLLHPHRRYLRMRGFDPYEVEKLWGLRGIGLASRCAWSIWIPIHFQGEIVSWTTRSIGDNGLRYITARPNEQAMSPKDLLYGADFASHTIIVVEGPTDVWRIGPGAVGVMGLQYSQKQVALIADYPTRFICFDDEPSAQRRAFKLASELREFPGQTSILAVTSSDPGSASDEQISELRELVA